MAIGQTLDSISAIQIKEIPYFVMDTVPIHDLVDPLTAGRYKFDKKLLKMHANAPLATLLQESPSVFVKSYGPSGSSTPSFRGTGASHTQLYWNGLPINSPMLGLTDLSLGNAGMFQEISLLYGAASVIHGDGGLGGAILLDNKGPRAGFRISAGQEYASFSNLKSNLGLDWGLGKWGFSTKVNYMQGKNDFPFTDISRSVPRQTTQEHSALQQLSILQQVHFSPNRKNEFSAFIWANGMDRELPPTMLTRNLTESQSDRSVRSLVKWKRKMKKGWNMAIRGAYFYENLHYQNGLAEIDSKSNVHQGFLEAKVNGVLHDKWRQLSGIRLNRIQALSPGYASPIVQTNATAFSQIQYFPNKEWQLGLIVRETFQANAWSTPAVVFDGQYAFHKRQQKFYFNAGRNFHLPGFNDLHWQPGGNPDLLAEDAWTGEMGWQMHRKSKWNQYAFKAQASAYASQVSNMILWVPGAGSIWAAENVQSVFIRGIETSVGCEKVYGDWQWSFEGKYGLTLSENRQNGQPNGLSEGKQLIYVPLHTGLVRLRVSRGNWNAIASQHFSGKRFTTRDNSEHLPAFSLGNVRLERRMVFQQVVLEAYGGVNNLWNTAYQTIPWRPMPGRNYLIGLRFNWKKP